MHLVSLTEAGETQAGRGENVQSDRAAQSLRGDGRRAATTVAAAGRRGDGHANPAAVQSKQIAPGFVHVQSVPLDALHDDRLQSRNTCARPFYQSRESNLARNVKFNSSRIFYSRLVSLGNLGNLGRRRLEAIVRITGP